MTLGAEVQAVIARYAPASVPSEASAFARQVVRAGSPASAARAKALLFSASKLAVFCLPLGYELRPEVCLSTSVIERFSLASAGRLSPPTLRTVRSNLRSLQRLVLAPAGGVALSRERSKLAYSEAEMAAYFSLARTQPTLSRRRRFEGLLCLGAGAGLMGADLRRVVGTDVVTRSGGVLVVVRGTRARVVPVRQRYHEALSASASFAGSGFVIGGRNVDRRTVTTPLVSSLAGGKDLPALDTGRLRATWLVAGAEAIGLKAFMDAAGIVCSQRLGDLVAGLDPVAEHRSVALLGGAP